MFSLIETLILQVDLNYSTEEALKSSVLRILMLLIFGSVLLWLYRMARLSIVKYLAKSLELEPKQRRSVIALLSAITFILIVLLIMYVYHLDWIVHERGEFRFGLTHILVGILLVLLARLFDYILAGYFTKSHKAASDQEASMWQDKSTSQADVRQGRRTLQSIVVAFFLYYLMKVVAIDYIIYETEVANKNLVITVSGIIQIVLVFLVGRLIAWFVTGVVLYNYYKRRKMNIGSRYAINQLVTYIIYVLALFVGLNSLGVKMTVVWGGLAALLVGVGFGLQQTINDFFSGLLLLFERGVEVGDVLYLKDEENKYGTVTKIGLRASKVRTIDNIFLIVPNSKLINYTVSNLSHFDNKARFTVEVNVRYGSDTELVEKLLLQCAREQNEVLRYPQPHVFFNDMTSSSLQFFLNFYVKNHMSIEMIKSDIRFKIDKLFREHKVEIPYTQLDVWFKNKADLDIE